MSDSEEDDWFTKDISDLIVIDPKKGSENKFQEEEDAEQKVKDERSSIYMLKDLNKKTNSYESEYGGSYNAPKSSKGTHKRTVNSDGNFVQAISLKKLFLISELSTLDLFLELSQVHDEFLETINRTNNSNEVLESLLKIIAKICEIPLFENRKNFLTKICETKIFWNQIIFYCKAHESSKKPKNKKKIIIQKCYGEVLADLLIYCTSVVQIMKLKFLKELCEILTNSKDVENFREILISFEDLRTILESSDLTEIEEIYPTLDDIHNDNPVYLKPNLTKGSYPDVKSYLDVHLSLLREDFIAPLRDGITEYKNSTANNNSRIYSKVRLVIKENLNSTKNQKGEIILVDLDPDSRDLPKRKLKDTNWANSKKFMYGSLLCFSTNSKFSDLILGVVSNCDPELLNDGFIQIELVKVYNAALNIFAEDLILMESEIFFEPYNHVYRVLKELTEDNFPMKKYIIENFSSPEYPSYISETSIVTYNYKNISFNLKDISTWPQKSLINLNQKQYEAFHSALTRKFCIIQGPPGCGKTFLGLEIISALLQNTKEQIMIICYTNHSLDQVLCGILKHTDNLVRMGGQSKNEILETFNIKQLTENNFSDKGLKTWYYNTKKEYSSLMTVFERLQNHFKICEDSEKKELLDQIYKIQNQLKSTSRRLDELKQIGEYNVIKDKRVIGMTTTCAARCHGLLKLLQTPIVLIEEAAEILESHIVAALTPHTQHLILIGDHKQLRPTTSVYKIAKEYKMNISLFERMVNNGINSTRLAIQHRMRPEISRLVRATTYPDLEDSESVQKYPSVKGMMNNLFFIDHNHLESKSKDDTSKKNPYESQYLLSLCNYLLLQGYSANDITILTTYNGQMFHMLQERNKYRKLENVRITVVDNYQGEESKIILLSIVRSNTENKIGFLSIKNRVCVAMSRAQQGFYIIGNMSVLCNASNVWKTLRADFEEQNCIGNDLSLKCQQHGTITNIRQPSDFDSMSSGGCHQKCESLLNCGHYCENICHTDVMKHFSKCKCN